MPVVMPTMRNRRIRKAACPLVPCVREARTCVCDDSKVCGCSKVLSLALYKRLVTLTGARRGHSNFVGADNQADSTRKGSFGVRCLLIQAMEVSQIGLLLFQ